LFGDFILEEIVFRTYSNAWWIVTSDDFQLPEVELDQKLEHSLWARPAHLLEDIDADVSCDSHEFVDNECYASQEDVSIDYQPFPGKLPPHAAQLAARCALLVEDERALAERPRPRSMFIDDKAAEDTRPRSTSKDERVADVKTDTRDTRIVPPATSTKSRQANASTSAKLVDKTITDFFQMKRINVPR